MNSRTQLRDQLLSILENPTTKKDMELIDAFGAIGFKVVDFVLNNVDSITPAQISDYGCSNFEKLDFRPNPSDRLVSDHEILEAVVKSQSLYEKVILVAIYLRFEEIRVCHKDFEGVEAAFDTQLSYNDFYKFGLV